MIVGIEYKHNCYALLNGKFCACDAQIRTRIEALTEHVYSIKHVFIYLLNFSLNNEIVLKETCIKMHLYEKYNLQCTVNVNWIGHIERNSILKLVNLGLQYRTMALTKYYYQSICTSNYSTKVHYFITSGGYFQWWISIKGTRLPLRQTATIGTHTFTPITQ